MNFKSLVKFAQGLGNTYRTARRPTSCVEFEDRIGRKKRPVPRSALPAETSGTGIRSDWDETDQNGVLAIEGKDGRSYTSLSSMPQYPTTLTRSPTYPHSHRSSDMLTAHSGGS